MAPRLAPGYQVWGRFNLYGPLIRAALGRAGEELRAKAVDALDLVPGAAAIDVGTGTGLTLPLLAARVGSSGRVVGLDSSTAMLAHAAARAPAPPLELHLASAEALPFADASFDAAIATYAMTAVDDAALAVSELVRVVRPGGRIAIAEVHAVNWPTPALVNAAVTRALRPFNTWHTERAIPPLLEAAGVAPAIIETGRQALSLTVATR